VAVLFVGFERLGLAGISKKMSNESLNTLQDQKTFFLTSFLDGLKIKTIFVNLFR
jgi:uncharacterized membrane protein